MSPKTIHLLNESKLYVSWGILVTMFTGVVAMTLMMARIMIQQEQFLKELSNIDYRVSRIETDLYFNKILNK